MIYLFQITGKGLDLAPELALLTLLHVLVFVYWLGGDLGAFYASRFLTAEGVPPDRRLLAARIVGDVDMAPRTALILMLPTGLILARQTGYIDLGWTLVWVTALVFLAWLALAWFRHLRHGRAPAWTGMLDLGLRWLTMAGLVAMAMAALTGHADWPLFLSVKLILLAVAIALGLLIRRVLSPLGPALAALAGGQDVATGEAQLRTLMTRARPLVMMIWACLLAAAFIGLWKPI